MNEHAVPSPGENNVHTGRGNHFWAIMEELSAYDDVSRYVDSWFNWLNVLEKSEEIPNFDVAVSKFNTVKNTCLELFFDKQYDSSDPRVVAVQRGLEFGFIAVSKGGLEHQMYEVFLLNLVTAPMTYRPVSSRMEWFAEFVAVNDCTGALQQEHELFKQTLCQVEESYRVAQSYMAHLDEYSEAFAAFIECVEPDDDGWL